MLPVVTTSSNQPPVVTSQSGSREVEQTGSFPRVEQPGSSASVEQSGSFPRVEQPGSSSTVEQPGSCNNSVYTTARTSSFGQFPFPQANVNDPLALGSLPKSGSFRPGFTNRQPILSTLPRMNPPPSHLVNGLGNKENMEPSQTVKGL